MRPVVLVLLALSVRLGPVLEAGGWPRPRPRGPARGRALILELLHVLVRERAPPRLLPSARSHLCR